jgi:Ser/Thr protein kinase RdoA (MazF antagonist)
MHTHSRAWSRPRGFTRKTWDFQATLGRTPYWGRWQDAFGLDAAGQELLRRAVDLIERRLAAFGSGPDRFGLIHADLRLANLLVHGDALTVIDFDDCGFGWFGYDFAASVSFMEHEPIVPDLMDSWMDGYREVAPLSGGNNRGTAGLHHAPAAYCSSPGSPRHSETPTAQELGIPYTEATLTMAEHFLARFS